MLAAVLTAVAYGWGLNVSPPHLTHDEIKFALQAHAIAETGRDINGRLLPLYFIEPGFSVGRDPLCIYVTAALLTVLPLSEQSIRLASVLIGAVSVGLTFVLARRLFIRPAVAWIATAVLALSPTFYIHSRLALSVIYPVPFTLMWLILLERYLQRPSRALALGLGAVLGIGIYSYLAAAIMMPVYLVATLVALGIGRDRRGMVAVGAAFAVTLVPLLAWQLIEPDRYANMLGAYRLVEPEQQSRLGTLPALVTAESLRTRASVFWDAFNPSRVFFTGESSLQISTREVGSVLTPVAVWLLIGLWTIIRTSGEPMRRILLFGLFSAPLPAVVMADVEIRRWLVVLPFVALLAALGAEQLLTGGRKARAFCLVLLALCGLQFALFSGDYFGAYRERSSIWFGGNIRRAVEHVLDARPSEQLSAIYIASDIPWVDAYWQFYVAVRDREPLLSRTQYFRISDAGVPQASPGAVIITPAADAALTTALNDAGWREQEVIADLDGRPSLTVGRVASTLVAR